MALTVQSGVEVKFPQAIAEEQSSDALNELLPDEMIREVFWFLGRIGGACSAVNPRV